MFWMHVSFVFVWEIGSFVTILIFILVDSSSPCPIYLTISPISHSAESSHLEINWGPKCSNPAEWIALYGEDPTVSYAAPLFTANTDDKPTGHIKTSVKLHKIHLPYGWNKHDVMNGLKPDHIKSACLPFFIASFNGRALQTLDCLKVQPNWMKEMPQIRNIALKNLFIPGTHCSGCYDRRTKTSHSILLKRFGYAQSFDVWTQLVFGVRYLDISVGFVLLLNRVNQEEHGELFNHFTDTKIITTRLMNHQICGLSMRIYLLHRCCQFYKRYDCLQCYPKKWLFWISLIFQVCESLLNSIQSQKRQWCRYRTQQQSGTSFWVTSDIGNGVRWHCIHPAMGYRYECRWFDYRNDGSIWKTHYHTL